jgi:hypothetical protein
MVGREKLGSDGIDGIDGIDMRGMCCDIDVKLVGR